MKDKDTIDLTHFLFPDRKMAKGVTRLLHNAPTAERICRLKYSDEENDKDFYLQVHKDRTMVFCNNTPDSSPYEINDRGEVERACLHLFNCIKQEKKPLGPEFPALLMSKRKYEELKESFDTNTTAQHLAEYLATVNGDIIPSVQLARVTKSSIRKGELKLCVNNESGWGFQYATFIGDHISSWQLRMSCDSAEDWLIAFPTTKAQLCSSFTEWVLQSTLMKS